MKNKFINSAFIFMAISLACLSSFASSSGALDFSFSNDGRVTSNFSVSTTGNKVTVSPFDGKALVSGTVNQGVSGNALFVARYNLDGTLDTTFNNTGVAIVNFGTNNMSGGLVVVQSDGNILVGGGFSLNSIDNIAIARLTPSGTLDTTFSGDGKVTFAFGNSIERLTDLDVAGSGKIVLTNFIPADYVLVQLNQDGSLDTAFSGDGRLVIDIGGGITNQVAASAIDFSGRIVVTGTGNTGNGVNGFGVVRVNPNGTLDSTFGTNGIVVVPIISNDRPTSIGFSFDGQGKIVIAGRAGEFGDGDAAAIVKLNFNGTLDTTFDGDGKLLFSRLGTTDNFTDISVANTTNGASSGRITALLTSGADKGIVRINPNGTFDNTFGNNGIYLGNNFGGNDLEIQLDGKIVLVGSANSSILLTRHTNNIQPTETADFDGDGTTDTAVFRPSTRDWFIMRSADNTIGIFQFGLNGDVPIDGDFDGDGKSDLAIFRPSSGVWFFQRSSDNTVLGAQFGQTGDKPIPGDYDKDGKTDIAFFRPSNSNWFVLRSSTNFSTFFGFQFGATGDIPLSSEQK
jgi:uncharacterized delta-60 repeat protein